MVGFRSAHFFQGTREIALRQRQTEAAPPHPLDRLVEPAHGCECADVREDSLLPQRPPRDSAGGHEEAGGDGGDGQDAGVRGLCGHRLAPGVRGDPGVGHESESHSFSGGLKFEMETCS